MDFQFLKYLKFIILVFMLTVVTSVFRIVAAADDLMADDDITPVDNSTVKVDVAEPSANPVAPQQTLDVNAMVNKANLDEKRARLRDQLKRDRADSKRARSIRRNLELDKDGLSAEEQALKQKLEYMRGQNNQNQNQKSTDSAKKFSQWVNDNMMLNKNKKNDDSPPSSDDLLK